MAEPVGHHGGRRTGLLLWLVLALPAAAQVPLLPPPAGSEGDEPWRLQSLLEDAGLEQQTIFCLAVQEDGTLWLGASTGLHRYDGYDWRHFTAQDGLPCDHVRSVCTTREGELWIGTDRGVCTFDGQQFDARGSSAHLAGPSVRRIRQTRDGSIWFCCDRWPDHHVSAGLTRLRAGTWRTYTTEDGLPTDYVSDLVEVSLGRVFVLTARGLAQLDGDGFRRPLEEAGLPGAEDHVWDLAEDTRDGILLAATSRYRYLWRGSGWQALPVTSSSITCGRLVGTRDGGIMSCTADGKPTLVAWREDHFVPVSSSVRGQGAYPEMLVEAPDGAIWVGGSSLLLRWEPAPAGEWSVYRGIPPVLERDGQGGIWCADGDRALRLHQGTWYEIPGGRAPLTADGQGGIWMRRGEGLAHWLPRTSTPVVPLEVQVPGLANLAVDARGDLWIVTRARGRELLRLQPGSRDPETIPLGERGEHLQPQTLQVDPAGGVLLLTRERGEEEYLLLRVGADGLDDYRMPADASPVRNPDVLVDPDRNLWLFGFFGLYRRGLFPSDAWERIHALPGSSVLGGAAWQEEIWFGSRGLTGGDSGLGRYREGRWMTWSLPVRGGGGSRTGVQPYFLAPEGLYLPGVDEPHEPRLLRLPVRGHVQSALPGEGKDCWISTREGDLFRFHPDGLTPETRLLDPPRELLAGKALMLDVVAVERWRPRSRTADYQVAVQLDGEPWSPFRSLRDGRLWLPRRELAVGPHRVRLRVRDRAGDVDPTPLVHEFRVIPVPLQARTWFLPLVAVTLVVILLLAGLSLVAWRVVARQARELEETVGQRTEELRASEGRYRGLFEQSRDAICVLDLEGRISQCNRAAQELLGAGSEEELVGQELTSLVGTPVQGTHALLQRASVQTLHGWVGPEDGVRLQVVLGVGILRDQEGRSVGYQALLRDVTRQRQLEEELRQSQKMEAIGRMAAGIAHDFNNLLMVILGHAELLARELEGSPDLREDVEGLLEGGRRARRLVEQIRTFSLGGAGIQGQAGIHEVLPDLDRLLRQVAGEKVELRVEVPREELWVHLRREQLEQIILNLCQNARDAMPTGGTLSLAARPVELDPVSARAASLTRTGTHLRLVVRDDGQGMDRRTLERVFEPFFSTRSRSGGTGLGLAVVYGLVHQAGGSIQVESTPGGGTTVTVHLPASATPPGPEQALEPAGEAGRGSGETVLVVDDEPHVLSVLRRTLQGSGYQVLEATSGEEALRMVQRSTNGIQLVVSDIVMPGMSGSELAQALGNLDPALPVLLVTGHPGLDTGERQALDPRIPLLRKPFPVEALQQRVRQLLDARTPRTSEETGGAPTGDARPPADSRGARGSPAG